MPETPRYVVDHVQITAPRAVEAEARAFYRDVLGFPEIAKPAELLANGGAWFQVGAIQVHLALEAVERGENERSRRHIAYAVDDLAAVERRVRAHGQEIIPDQQPVPGMIRFYLRDPAGNRVEIFQRVPRS